MTTIVKRIRITNTIAIMEIILFFRLRIKITPYWILYIKIITYFKLYVNKEILPAKRQTGNTCLEWKDIPSQLVKYPDLQKPEYEC